MKNLFIFPFNNKHKDFEDKILMFLTLFFFFFLSFLFFSKIFEVPYVNHLQLLSWSQLWNYYFFLFLFPPSQLKPPSRSLPPLQSWSYCHGDRLQFRYSYAKVSNFTILFTFFFFLSLTFLRYVGILRPCYPPFCCFYHIQLLSLF